MRTVQEIVRSFPEPFRSATKLDSFSFDYKLNPGKCDHEYLKRNGYVLNMASDCSFYAKGLPGLNATSYGDWGSVYSGCNENNKGFEVFCQMYEEGIIKLWRIRFYSDNVSYQYDDDYKKWVKYENCRWVACENPLT